MLELVQNFDHIVWFNRNYVRFQLGDRVVQQKNVTIKELTEERAIELGIEMVGECIVLSVPIVFVTMSLYIRNKEEQNAKQHKNMLIEEFGMIQKQLGTLQEKIVDLEAQIKHSTVPVGYSQQREQGIARSGGNDGTLVATIKAQDSHTKGYEVDSWIDNMQQAINNLRQQMQSLNKSTFAHVQTNNT
ncbi:hypothetical protein RFI_26618 [Reticulomyxa filosa]|uniref:Uncharacterized protein n=1 Tax=Reticulomyxa filosa TaxID=46433 RepID=X6M9S1_RETFI|nr:hypothetical protein RFI_26618 [Reticulomyxa filosa]|eukprot:ETO10758.1 hypothetical protein RFI_26618 [Reticulomyxa filosa]